MKPSRRAVLPLLVLVALATGPQGAGAQPRTATDQAGPLELVRGSVSRVLAIVQAPRVVARGDAQRTAEIRRVAQGLFDFDEMARLTLAQHWKARSAPEREEFVVLFTDLLERSYISKIETYGGEKIQYTAEKIDGDLATVSTRIVTKNGTEVPVDYRMKKGADRWLVYDVSIEGVSLVSSYRTQFNKIIQTSSYNELVSKLRTKQDELLAEDKGQKKGK
jgi:phospholipid transport system substrate-binding protein